MRFVPFVPVIGNVVTDDLIILRINGVLFFNHRNYDTCDGHFTIVQLCIDNN